MTVYFDVTDLISESQFTHRLSGFQRVGLMVAKLLQAEVDNIKFFFWHPFDGHPYLLEGLDFSTQEDLRNFEPIVNFWKIRLSRNGELRREISNCRSFVKKIKVLGRWVRSLYYRYSQAYISYGKDGVVFHPFDDFGTIATFLFFTPINPDAVDSIKSRFKDTRTVFFIHDLIPLTLPEYVSPNETECFSRYIPYVMKTADLILTSSESNKRDLLSYAERIKICDRPFLKIELTQLPGEETAKFKNSDIKNLRPEVRWLSKYKFCISVGTIGMRKNHFEMVQAWQRFWKSDCYNNELLVIVGNCNRELEWLDSRLATLAGGSIIRIPSANEKELAFLYEKCRFSIYPSFAEGWGMPVSESISFGKPAIHLMESAIPEAGFGSSIGIERDDLHAFECVIARLFKDEEYYQQQREKIEATKNILPTWEDFAKRVLSAISPLIEIKHS